MLAFGRMMRALCVAWRVRYSPAKEWMHSMCREQSSASGVPNERHGRSGRTDSRVRRNRASVPRRTRADPYRRQAASRAARRAPESTGTQYEREPREVSPYTDDAVLDALIAAGLGDVEREFITPSQYEAAMRGEVVRGK